MAITSPTLLFEILNLFNSFCLWTAFGSCRLSAALSHQPADWRLCAGQAWVAGFTSQTSHKAVQPTESPCSPLNEHPKKNKPLFVNMGVSNWF